MSYSNEPSYYEIALTSRQVLVGFILLLACMLGTFFTGVWFGRGAPTDAVAAPGEERLATVELDPEATSAAGEDGELPEVRFFADDETEAGDGGVDPESVPGVRVEETTPEPVRSRKGTTLAQDLSTADETPARAARPTPPPERTAPEETPPRRTEPEPAETRPAETRPPETRPAETPPARPQVREAPVDTTPSPGGACFIQVFSTRDRIKAQEVLERLVLGGYPATLATLDEGESVMHRVRVGPYEDREAAGPIGDDVRRKYKLDIWVTCG